LQHSFRSFAQTMLPKEKSRAAWLLAITITALSLSRPALAQSSPTATSTPARVDGMIFAGDSIMAGWAATTAGHTVVNRLGELRPYWWIRNYSYGFASVSGSPERAAMNASNIVPLFGNPIVIFLGTNDWSLDIPIATFSRNYSQFVSTFDYLHPQVICVTPVWRSGEEKPNKVGLPLSEYRKAITEICTDDGHPVIDGLGLIPHDPKNYVDGLHPNDAGYEYYARNLAEALDRFVSP
jgi:lysophospholipase L1-like esterase